MAQQLLEAFNSEPYAWEKVEKNGMMDIVYSFTDEQDHSYRYHFEKRVNYGRNVFVVTLGQKAPSLKMYKRVFGKFANPLRVIATLIEVIKDVKATRHDVKGIILEVPEQAFGSHGKLVDRILKRELRTELNVEDMEFEADEFETLGLKGTVATLKPNRFKQVFTGKLMQEILDKRAAAGNEYVGADESPVAVQEVPKPASAFKNPAVEAPTKQTKKPLHIDIKYDGDFQAGRSYSVTVVGLDKKDDGGIGDILDEYGFTFEGSNNIRYLFSYPASKVEKLDADIEDAINRINKFTDYSASIRVKLISITHIVKYQERATACFSIEEEMRVAYFAMLAAGHEDIGTLNGTGQGEDKYRLIDTSGELSAQEFANILEPLIGKAFRVDAIAAQAVSNPLEDARIDISADEGDTPTSTHIVFQHPSTTEQPGIQDAIITIVKKVIPQAKRAGGSQLDDMFSMVVAGGYLTFNDELKEIQTALNDEDAEAVLHLPEVSTEIATLTPRNIQSGALEVTYDISIGDAVVDKRDVLRELSFLGDKAANEYDHHKSFDYNAQTITFGSERGTTLKNIVEFFEDSAAKQGYKFNGSAAGLITLEDDGSSIQEKSKTKDGYEFEVDGNRLTFKTDMNFAVIMQYVFGWFKEEFECLDGVKRFHHKYEDVSANFIGVLEKLSIAEAISKRVSEQFAGIISKTDKTMDLSSTMYERNIGAPEWQISDYRQFVGNVELHKNGSATVIFISTAGPFVRSVQEQFGSADFQTNENTNHLRVTLDGNFSIKEYDAGLVGKFLKAHDDNFGVLSTRFYPTKIIKAGKVTYQSSKKFASISLTQDVACYLVGLEQYEQNSKTSSTVSFEGIETLDDFYALCNVLSGYDFEGNFLKAFKCSKYISDARAKGSDGTLEISKNGKELSVKILQDTIAISLKGMTLPEISVPFWKAGDASALLRTYYMGHKKFNDAMVVLDNFLDKELSEASTSEIAGVDDIPTVEQKFHLEHQKGGFKIVTTSPLATILLLNDLQLDLTDNKDGSVYVKLSHFSKTVGTKKQVVNALTAAGYVEGEHVATPGSAAAQPKVTTVVEPVTSINWATAETALKGQYFKDSNYKVVNMKVDELISRQANDFRIDAGSETNRIKGRAERALAHITSGAPMDMPVVEIDNQGNLQVVDGRHRIAVAKEMGLKEIPVFLSDASSSKQNPSAKYAYSMHSSDRYISLEASDKSLKAIEKYFNENMLKAFPIYTISRNSSKELIVKFNMYTSASVIQQASEWIIDAIGQPTTETGVPEVDALHKGDNKFEIAEQVQAMRKKGKPFILAPNAKTLTKKGLPIQGVLLLDIDGNGRFYKTHGESITIAQAMNWKDKFDIKHDIKSAFSKLKGGKGYNGTVRMFDLSFDATGVKIQNVVATETPKLKLFNDLTIKLAKQGGLPQKTINVKGDDVFITKLSMSGMYNTEERNLSFLMDSNPLYTSIDNLNAEVKRRLLQLVGSSAERIKSAIESWTNGRIKVESVRGSGVKMNESIKEDLTGAAPKINKVKKSLLESAMRQMGIYHSFFGYGGASFATSINEGVVDILPTQGNIDHLQKMLGIKLGHELVKDARGGLCFDIS